MRELHALPLIPCPVGAHDPDLSDDAERCTVAHLDGNCCRRCKKCHAWVSMEPAR